jgi:hypothetical protein
MDYPVTLPNPEVSGHVPKVRTRSTDLPGLDQYSQFEYDYSGAIDVEFFFNAEQSAIFWSFWKTSLIYGGRWFNCAWPALRPGPMVVQFISQPKLTHVYSGSYRVAATVQVRGASLSVHPFIGPLDNYTLNLWGAYSVDRLLSSYTGPSVKARDFSNGALQDIGFTVVGGFNASELSTFLGTHNGSCSSWYSQEGTLARAWGAPFPSQYPTIATAGSFYGALSFDSTVPHQMLTGAASGTPSAFTIYFRGRLRSPLGAQIILEHSANYNSNESMVVYYESGALSIGVHRSVPSGAARSDFTGDFPNNNVHCWAVDRTQLTSAAMTKLYINGVNDVRSADGSAGTLPAGNFTAQGWYLGARGVLAAPASLDAHTLLIYEGVHSDVEKAAISSIVAALP